jgi:predicted enzyme related to lactoylglutathione lyase
MPHVEAHQPGTFCWFELATTDAARAKAFYLPLFGWTANDFPMGPSEVYTVFQKDGRDAAAGYTMREDMQKAGVPPHWMPYITVESADDSAKKAASLGGTLVMPPFDVMDKGRMVVVADPSGATFALWQPNTSPGVEVINEPGSFAWAELHSGDVDKAKAFYTGLFGWTAAGMPVGDAEYTVFSLGERPAGGMFPLMPGQPPVSYWETYFEVPDCDAAVAAATADGGSVRMPPTSMDGVGRFASLTAPVGGAFSVIKSATM